MDESKGQLPIVIRYNAQDYETRWVPDPRVGYVKSFREEHRDDGFVAIIPSAQPRPRSADAVPPPIQHRHSCHAWLIALLAIGICLAAFALGRLI